MKVRLIVVLSCLLLAAAAPAASSKDATYTQSTAVVVRAHPWLTRGLPRESLIGIRFWGVEGAYGGGLESVTFSLRLENCTREQLGSIKLWRMDFNNNYGFYEPAAIRLDGVHGTLSKEQTGEDTYTFTFKGDGNASQGSPDWFYPHTPGRVESDYIWLTAEIDPAISRDAKIYADVTDSSISIGGCVYQVDNNLLSDGTVAPHRVYPFKYRINAYLRADRMRGVYASDILDNATAARLAGLTDVMLSSLKVTYNRNSDSFYLNLAEAYTNVGRRTYGDGLRRLTDLRDGTNEGGGNPNHYAAPHLRVFASLDKGPFIQALNADGSGKTEHAGYDAEGNEIRKPVWEKLDSNGDGAHEAYPLGHAAGSRYRAKLVDDIVTMMKEYNLDGLDIDWEYPNQIRDGVAGGGNGNKEYEKYGLLLRDLSEAFFNHGWELAMCTNQTGWQIPDGPKLAAADFVNSMAYGPWPTFLGNSVMTQGINVCTARSIPKRRIIVGQAMYSNAYWQYGWGEVANFIRQAHSDRFTRQDCDTVWRNWSVNGKTGAYVNSTGPSTYRAKCNRARLDGYGGVMSWGYYSDCVWNDADLLSLGRNQWQAIWPHDVWQPPQAEDGFYLLDSEEDWFWFQDNPGHNVRLAADITFTHDPLPIASFSHTLDGNGCTITLPKDVWLCTFDNTALFQSITGTVKDLTVVLEGRVVCRADRKNDSSVYTSSVAGDGRAAVLAAALIDPGKLENVTVRVAAGAEVQGAKQAAAVVGDVWHGSNSDWLAMKGVRVEIDGIVRNLADNSGGTTFNPNGVCAGGLLAKLGEGDGVTGVRLEDCSVRVGAQGRIANETGTAAVAAAGAIGHLATTSPTIQNLTVSLASADSVTSVAGNAPTGNSAQPWLNAYYAITVTGEDLSGAVTVPRGQRSAFREKWNPYWLETVAPLLDPGYRLRLR